MRTSHAQPKGFASLRYWNHRRRQQSSAKAIDPASRTLTAKLLALTGIPFQFVMTRSAQGTF
jgi:hypothetical protein